MTRTAPLLALLAATLVASPALPAFSDAPVRAPAAVPDLDSARAEMEVGRYWHAARHLRNLRAEGADFGPAEILLLARAEAGYLNWEAVVGALEGRSWLSEVGGGEGLRLLGRGLEGVERWEAAAGAYEAWLAAPDGLGSDERDAVRARLARVRVRRGSTTEAVAEMDGIGMEPLRSWVALELARERAAEGDTAAVGRLVPLAGGAAAARAEPLPPRAFLEAGDTARAVGVYRRWLTQASTSEPLRGEAHRVVGEVALARGDSAEAVGHFASALGFAPRRTDGVRSAQRLVEMDALGDSGLALQAARTLDRAGDEARSARAWDRYVELAPTPLDPALRLERARVLADAPRRADEAVEAFRSLWALEELDPDVGVELLEAWIGLRRRQGREGDVSTLRGWLLERYPASPPAVELIFLRGDAAHDRRDWDRALDAYGRLQELAPSLDRSGLARMRSAHIHLERGDTGRALRELDAYLDAFPEGRRWEEASWWAGTLRLARGDSAAGRALLDRIAEESPLSYYAVLVAARDARPYGPAAGAPAPPEPPSWLRRELELLDLLEVAGLEEGREARLAAMTERALGEAPEVGLALARGLVERGLTLEAINLGWALRERGAPLDRPLLEVLYPYPYRTMVERVARERGLDPFLLAGLIRQESAFDVDIVSRAGAVGLMQVMPPTGRQVARSVGPEDFHPRSLTTPEINLHLGSLYLQELLGRYESLPLVLSAYNAGPTRANRWRDFPEAGDPLRFTERIPFGETRDYVKLVTRNQALYRALYGETGTVEAASESTASRR